MRRLIPALRRMEVTKRDIRREIAVMMPENMEKAVVTKSTVLYTCRQELWASCDGLSR
jgi:hypothetical protein